MSKEQIKKLSAEELECVVGGMGSIQSSYLNEVDPDGTGKNPDPDNPIG